MARQPRKESSTGYYHVMLRGINRDFFFKDDSHKQTLLTLIKEQQEDNLLQLVSWCIMDNHVHMIIKADKANMSKASKIISLKFAARYNKVQQRSGPVFGDRYRSECIEDDAYLLGALRYVHQNPVRAKLTANISDYLWSSYREYTEKSRYISEEQKRFVMGLFGDNMQDFIKFHAHTDGTEYLETREDLERYQRENAFQVLEAFCVEKGIVRAKQVYSDPELFAEVCVRLTKEAGLSLRQAADILETSHKRVHLALRDDD